MKYTYFLHSILSVLVMMQVSPVAVHAQDREIGNARQVFIDSTAYVSLIAPITVGSGDSKYGWNWGLPISKFNDAIRAKTMHFPYAYSWRSGSVLSAIGEQFRDGTTESTTEAVFLFPHVRSDGITKNGEQGLEEYKCLRYDPEITVQKKNFAPDPTASPGATFGFQYKHPDVGVSGHHITLSATDFPADDTTIVLANVWPDSAMYTRYPGKDTVHRQHDPQSVQDGLNMLLSVNLRRATGADTTRDTMAVLILRLKYTTFNGDTGYVAFDMLPDPDSLQQMNGSDPSYGLRYNETLIATATPNFIIRRHHLPSSTDNINLSARAHFPKLGEVGLEDVNPILQRLYAPHYDTVINRLDIEVRYVTHASSGNNVDIEIDAFKIETPRSRDFLSGNDSTTFVTEHIKFLRDLDFMNTTTGRQYRIGSWYAKDEAIMMYWEGWRQYNRLVDTFSISEVNLDYCHHLLHKTEVRRLWQGHTLRIGNQVAVPYYERGFADPALGRTDTYDYLNFKFGTFHQVYSGTHIHETDSTDVLAVDYETFWGHKEIDSTLYSVELPMPDSQYSYRVCSDENLEAVLSLSPQCAIEGWYYRYSVNPEFLFLGAGIPWYANIWPNSEWLKKPTDRNFINYHSRPSTGSEAHCMAFGQLILGAKGLLAFYAVSANEGSSPERPYNTPEGATLTIGATRMSLSASPPSTTGMSLILDDDLGADFFNIDTAQESSRVTTFMLSPTSGLQPDMEYFATSLGVDSSRIYVGSASNRLALHNAYTFADYHRTSLENLELQAWWAKGYRQWTREKNTFSISDFLRLDTSLAVAHPSRIDSIGIMNNEDYDSVFVDITVHKHKDSTMDAVFYVGIANRRTDPRIWNDSTDTWQFYTEPEYKAMCDTGGLSLFAQKGAREIRVPFNYTPPGGLPFNLVVTQLLGPTSTVEAIDTMIGSTGIIHVKLQPGYGTFLRVKPVPASETSQIGFLEHSNQRKLVAYPQLVQMDTVTDEVDSRTYLRIVSGDTMWYHHVYHRRRPSGGGPQAGALAVYYRRSLPIVTHDTTTLGTNYDVFNASLVSWEQEQLISDHVLYQLPGPPPPTDLDLSCGFPALVVRPAETDTGWVSQVYVVFGCEYLVSEQPDKVLVCETILPAEAPRDAQIAYYTANTSRVLDVTTAPSGPILERWGTPMINASQDGNFYCWSHATNGIGAGFKIPTARTFAPGQKMYIMASDLDYATHPSLNSYSRLHVGEPDAALVWQEGNDPTLATFIFYTRLRHTGAPGYAIDYFLNLGPSRMLTGTSFVSSFDADIGLVTDNYANVDSVDMSVGHSYPVIYRHLSDFETTIENSRHTLRLVNHKAERIYWQSRRTHLDLGPWMIGRRAIDIADSYYSPDGGTDELYSLPEQYIYSESTHLRGPDVSQGEQWGEPGTTPHNPLPNFDDSCSVLNFWSDTSDTDMQPRLWHMLFGYAFYGSVIDHDYTDLISAGKLQELHGNGRYPHLAARYSVVANMGYQRSRRIYNERLGNWTNYASAPQMRSSSEYFFKDKVNAQKPQGIVYSGFRGNKLSTTVGPIFLHDREDLVALKGVTLSLQDSTTKFREPAPEIFRSEWIEFEESSNVTFTTNVEGIEASARMYIEREWDGERLVLDELTAKRDYTFLTASYTVVANKGERFRFVVEPMSESVFSVEDVEIVFPQEQDFEKSANQFFYGGLLDLRTMMSSKTATMENGISIFPNPSTESTTIAFDIKTPNVTTQSQKASNAVVVIYNPQGQEIHRLACKSTDAVYLNTSELPMGLYGVFIYTNSVSPTKLYATFSVIR